MSLFDVIKYPISIPPTEEELKALPNNLLVQWMKDAGFASPEFRSIDRAIEFYTESIGTFVISIHVITEDVTILKEIIRKYDGSV